MLSDNSTFCVNFVSLNRIFNFSYAEYRLNLHMVGVVTLPHMTAVVVIRVGVVVLVVVVVEVVVAVEFLVAQIIAVYLWSFVFILISQF